MRYTEQEWYTPAEVAVHNTPEDCWVILRGRVLRMTEWLQQQLRDCKCTKSCSCAVKNWFCGDDCTELCPCFKRGFPYCDAKRLAKTIIAYAGKEVTHWFKDEDWVRYMHPTTGAEVPFMTHGAGMRQPAAPSTRWRPVAAPWWLDQGIVVGKATARARPIRITNTITGSTVTLEVCSEETLQQISMRYFPHNAHCASYAWRYRGRGLCAERTLEQNGIPDDRALYDDLALPDNFHIPAILLYYNDDLTIDPPRDDCYCLGNTCIKGLPEKCYANVTDF